GNPARTAHRPRGAGAATEQLPQELPDPASGGATARPKSCPGRCATGPPGPGRTTPPPSSGSARCPAAGEPRSASCRTASTPAAPPPPPAAAASCPAPAVAPG